MNDYKDMMFDADDFEPVGYYVRRSALDSRISITHSNACVSVPLSVYKKMSMTGKVFFLRHKHNKFIFELRPIESGGRVFAQKGNKAAGYFSVDLTADFKVGNYEIEIIENPHRPRSLCFEILPETICPLKKSKEKANETTSATNKT